MRRRYALLSIMGLVGLIIASPGLIAPLADQMNRQAVRWITEPAPYPAGLVFRYLHVLGNGEAANNLGVLYLRGIGVERDRERAIALFETAVGKGVVAARYNLVLTMPNRFRTPNDIIQRQLALLEENVDHGDIPSHVLAAERLYYANREDFVPDRETRKLALLEAAARTGDADYLYQYGKELEVQAFERDDAGLMIDALRAYRHAFDNGNMRGAEALGAARRISVWDAEPKRADVLEKSEDEWTLIAAQSGSITAKCRHGIRRFGWMKELSGLLDEPSRLQDRIDRYLAEENPVSPAMSLAYLRQCAEAKKIIFPVNPPFGDIALYARKRRGSVTSLANSPEWATYYLGKLYALGLHVEEDIDAALTYFDRTAKKGPFAQSEVWTTYLASRRSQP